MRNSTLNFTVTMRCVPTSNMFRKDVKGFLPELMEKMYGDRKVFKKKMLKSKQQLVDIEI